MESATAEFLARRPTCERLDSREAGWYPMTSGYCMMSSFRESARARTSPTDPREHTDSLK